jgi:hypothetical protein
MLKGQERIGYPDNSKEKNISEEIFFIIKHISVINIVV